MGSDDHVWGKLEHDSAGRVSRSQTLAGHCRDVAAVFAALLNIPGLGQRLARLTGNRELDSVARARLSYLVHLHDCGKVNAGFQARRNPRAAPIGHIKPLAALFGRSPAPTLIGPAWQAIGADRLESWGDGVPDLLHAIFSHHGRPWPADADGQREAEHWRADNGYDPLAALCALREDAERFLPDALAAGGNPLPVTPAFVHAIAGLVQLADWVASSGWETAPSDASRSAWAVQRLQDIGLDPEPWRASIRSKGLPSFEALFGGTAYPHQELAASAEGQLVVLESETGSGKTEAALWRFARLFAAGKVDGLYFALPTRTAAVQVHGRVEAFAHRLWPVAPPAVVLAVPGYLDDDGLGALPRAPEPLDAVEGDARGAPVWAAEHPKRYFAAVASVGTIDQALLACLRVKHAHLRGATLMRHLLVVDEVHASDTYMRRLLSQLLHDHLAAGGHALLLSATLGAEARNALLLDGAGGRSRDVAGPTLEEAVRAPYPLLSVAAPHAARHRVVSRGEGKAVAMRLRPWLDDTAAIAEAALAAARDGAKVLVIRNSVAGAVELQRMLEAQTKHTTEPLFLVRGIATLHHGRFAREDRRLLDAAVESAVGRRRQPGGLVVVGTQTLEQSLDIDADLLITDLCPADVLLQRLGRLHRHATEPTGTPRVRPVAYREPQAIVLEPMGGLQQFLRPRRPAGLPRHGLGHQVIDRVPQGVYRDLTVVEATRRLVVDHPCWRIPAMNRQIVEGAVHSSAIAAMLATFDEHLRDEWVRHRATIEGDSLGQSLIARESVLVRDRPFMEQVMANDERLVTRLGANDRLIDLPPGTVGPFRQIVRRLAVPAWLLPGVGADMLPAVERDSTSSGLRVRLGDVHLIYDRHGLRAAQERS